MQMNKRLKMKRQRSGRTTLQQYHRMLDFFLVEKGLAEGRYVALHGKKEAQKKWQELAKTLNGYENGAQKTPEQWQVVWRDLKSRTVIKARTIRELQKKNEYHSQPQLTDLDKRVIGLFHTNYIYGIMVPSLMENSQDENNSQNEEEIDETPDYTKEYIPVFNEANFEEVIKQEEETNDQTFSSKSPSQSTATYTRRSIPSTSFGRITSKRKRDNEEKTDETPDCTKGFNEANFDEVIKQEEETTDQIFPSNLPSESTDTYTRRSIPSTSFGRITIKRKRDNPDEYIKMSRQYMSIAKRQADAMMMFAEAERNHAEAARVNAQALHRLSLGLEKLGDIAKAQVESNRQHFELMQNMTKVIQSFAPEFIKD